MKQLLLIFFILTLKISNCQEKTQEDLSQFLNATNKPTAKWEVYKIYPTQVSVKLPGIPNINRTNSLVLNQITYTVETDKSIDSNYIYYFSVIKFKNGYTMDSSDMIKQEKKLINEMNKNCKLTIISEKKVLYNERKGVQLIADVIWSDNKKFIAKMEITYIGEYCISQFVLGNKESIQNWSSNLYFNSVSIE